MDKLTVLMTVKNGERDINECLDSILNQTYSDFEFLIFDDNSTDRTVDIIESYQDSRITLFRDSNGYIGNLNRGIDLAKGKYIARMDHDDIMDITKLAIQLEVMETLKVDICATWVYLFGGPYHRPRLEGSEHGIVEDPMKSLYRVNFIHHSTVMLRRDFLLENNLRYEEYFPADDYKLWYEMAKKEAVFYMIPEPLLYYRYSSYQAGSIYAKECVEKTAIIQQQISSSLSKRLIT
jgi:glycosyltransferase involved in cell wall biosynthesis